MSGGGLLLEAALRAPDVAAIAAHSVAPMMRYVEWAQTARTYFDGEPGREHYRLLAWIARQFRGKAFLDIGTYQGASAAALAVEPSNRVVSYDIEDVLPARGSGAATVRDLPNVELRYADISAPAAMARALEELGGSDAVPLVVLDVDPHDGVQERRFLDALRAAGYRGVVLMDDIHLNDSMRRMWAEIPEPKRDLTAAGHWSGTGAVFLSGGAAPGAAAACGGLRCRLDDLLVLASGE